jgi:hypothetical protein
MDESSRSEQLQRIREFCRRPPRAVLLDEPTATLYDVFSAKAAPLHAEELDKVLEWSDRETKRPYLLLVYGDGRQLVLAEQGVCFPPQTAATGPLPDLPQVVCFRDYASILARVKHELYEHLDQPPNRTTVGALMMCIAIVDGGRGAGFEVSTEERELEKHLAELERRAPRPA